MRRLLIVCGPQGSGKSTFIREQGWDRFALSGDKVRQIAAGPTLSVHGLMAINNQENEFAEKLFGELVERRFDKGEFVVVERALMTRAEARAWTSKARAFGYKVAVMDTFHWETLETLKRRNKERPEEERIAFEHFEEFAESRPWETWGGLDRLFNGSREDAKSGANAWLEPRIEDLSGYDRVVHIGDIQGCWSVMADPQGEGPLAGGFRDDTCYIFTGDFLDRGIENAEVLRWAIDNRLADRENVRMVMGNHEYHLERWVRGQKSRSHEFLQHTLPELHRAKIGKDETRHFIQAFRECLRYRWHDKHVFVCHAGLPIVPKHPHFISNFQYTHGVGGYGYPVDEKFDELADPSWFQVHGHANQKRLPIQASNRSFNLESRVEHGGRLRWLVLDEKGFSPRSARNRTVRPIRDRLRNFSRVMTPDWVRRPQDTLLGEDLLQAMREHPGVREVVSQSHPHIASMVFSKKVFFDRAWDDVVVRARGLFFNRQTREIVARAYDKFFEIDEHASSKMDVLTHGSWPLAAYRKENGFLGLLGYDTQNDNLFYSSKSNPDSPFAAIFKNIMENTLSPADREHLMVWLRDNEACAAFEVIDPDNDPHMIDYASPQVVLLDVFHRSAELERLPYKQLKAFAKDMRLPFVKSPDVTPKTPEMFVGWGNRVVTDLAYKGKTEDYVEGYVVESPEGVMVKIKSAHYAFWKEMRGAVNRLLKERRLVAEGHMKADDVDERWTHRAKTHRHPLGSAFLGWAKDTPSEHLSQGIIKARKAFEESSLFREEDLQVPYEPRFGNPFAKPLEDLREQKSEDISSGARRRPSLPR